MSASADRKISRFARTSALWFTSFVFCSLTIEMMDVLRMAARRAQGVRNQHRTTNELRSNAIRHTVDALAPGGDEGRGKLR